MGREVQDEHFDIFQEITIISCTILANKSPGTKKTLDNLTLLIHDFSKISDYLSKFSDVKTLKIGLDKEITKMFIYLAL